MTRQAGACLKSSSGVGPALSPVIRTGTRCRAAGESSPALNPRLFQVAPSGLRIADPPCNVGAAPRGCPSGSNGATLSRRGRRMEHAPVLVRRHQPLRSVPNLFLSRARGLKTGFCFGRYSYDVPRHAYVGFRQGQEKTGFASGRCFNPVPDLLRGVPTPRNLCPLWPISCCFRRWIPRRPSCFCAGANRGLPGRRWASCPAQGFCPSISECRTRRGWQ